MLFTIIVAELLVLDDHEGLGVFEKLLAFFSGFEHTIVLNVLADVSREHALTHDRSQEILVPAVGRAEDFELVMLVTLNLVGGIATDYVDYILGLEALFEHNDGLDGRTQFVTGLDALAGMDAVVAIAAVVLVVGLAEVVQQCLAATHRRLGIVGRLVEKLFSNLLLIEWLALHELLKLEQVLLGIESDALAFTAITSGTSGLLVITFQTLGNIVVDDKAHVWLVNAHAEGDGRHNDVDLLEQELVLVLAAGGAVHACVIGQRLDAIDAQQLGKVLNTLATEAIDDARLAFIGLDKLNDVLVDVLGLGPNLVVEVGTVER